MQLRFSEKQNSRLQLAADGVAALALSVGFLGLWISAFSLSWTPKQALAGNPLQGFLSVWNRLADVLGRALYLLLPRFSGGMGKGGEALPQGAFLTLAALILAGVLFLVIRSRWRSLLLLLLVPWVLLMFCAEVNPGFYWMLGFVCVLALAWVQMGGECFRRGTALAVIGLILALSLGTGWMINRQLTFDPLQITGKTGQAIEDFLHGRYGSGALKNGRLNALSGKEQAKKRGTMSRRQAVLTGQGKDKTETALAVSGKELESYYLRGFVGEKYRSDRWEHLQNGVYYEARDNMYWLNKSGFDGLSQVSRVAELVDGQAERKALSIKVMHADKSQLYTPYEMMGTEKSCPKGSRNYAGAFLGSARFFGSGSYKLQCGPNMTGEWTDWVGQLYSAGSTPEIMEYFTSESHYNVWCYERDTEVPKKLWQQICQELGDPGDLTGNHTDYKKAIETVTTYLEENCLYTDRFKALDRKEDFLEKFLQSHKGCDVHFASLATMMFRFYRIPARYVEGYLLTPADVEKGNKVQLGQSHQHAWTEIYVDGFGWVPVEVTPEYREIMEEPDMETGLQSVSYNSIMPENPPPTSEEEQITEEGDKYSKLFRKILMILGILLLSLLLLGLLFLAGRKVWREWRRYKNFYQSQPRQGVCALYGYMLEEKYAISPRGVTIGDAAAFSQLEIREEHRKAMLAELDRCRQERKLERKAERARRRRSIGRRRRHEK